MSSFSSPRQWSIRTKSAVLVILYVLALYAVYGSFTLYLLHRETQETEARFLQTAQIVAAQLDAHLDSGSRQLTEAAALPEVSYGVEALSKAQRQRGEFPFSTALHYMFSRSPVFTGGMFLLDREDYVLWTKPPSLSEFGQALVQSPELAQVYEQNTLVISASIEASPLFPQPHVVIAVPIRTRTGEVQGVLGGVINLAGPTLFNILDGVSTERDRFVEIVDQDNRVVASTKPGRLLQQIVIGAEQDNSVFTATATLTRAPWRVVSGQPRDILMAHVSRMHHLLWWCGFGMILLAIAGGAPFVNKVVGPIKELTMDANRMAGGDLSFPITVPNRYDEVATLAAAFELMRVELGRSRTALEVKLYEREELIRLKEEFLGNISHELRTPLHVIMGYSDMLSGQEPDESKRAMMNHIRAKADQLFGLIGDLITVSSLNAGKVSLQVGSVLVADLFERLAAIVEPLCRDKELEIIWDCPPSLPVIETDATHLERILMNLVTNAIKFSLRGRVTVRARQVLGQDLVVFEVSDTGIGIPAKELSFIFDEFRQVDGSISRIYGGMGLGLALVKKLVRLLEGEITVVSQLGQGTTFTATLPRRLSARNTVEQDGSTSTPVTDHALSEIGTREEVEAHVM